MTSYILISLVALSRTKIGFLLIIPDSVILNSGLAILLGTLFSIIFAWVFSCKWFSKVTVFMFHKTPNDDIWRDVLDFQNGSNLKVYLKHENYYVIGHHKNHEEKDGDCWLAISAFGKFNKLTNLPLENEPSHLEDDNVIYTIRFSDIEHIEIF